MLSGFACSFFVIIEHRVKQPVNIEGVFVRRSHYARLREAGHSQGRALRGVGDRLIHILMAALRTGIPYSAEIRKQSPSNGVALTVPI